MTETTAGNRMAAWLGELIWFLPGLDQRNRERMQAIGNEKLAEVEAEVTAAAEQRLRERIRNLNEYDKAVGWKRRVLALLDSDAPAPRETKEPLRCGNCGGPWHGALCSVPPAASPRQGEPVAEPEELCGNPDPTGGRWTDYPCWRASGHTGEHESRSHVWADGETIHGERLSDPAEPVAPDKEGNG